MANVTINEGTQTAVKTDTVSGAEYQVIKLDMGTTGVSNPFSGTIPRISTIGTLELGTVTLTNPTGTTVTVDHGTVTLSNPTGTTVQFNNGTVDLLKAGTITRLEGGTVQTNILTGTITSVTDIANLSKGTITRIEGGTITRISNVGTLEVGTISTLPNIPGGTIGLVTRVGNVGTLEVGTISTLPNIPGGSIRITTGTITTGNAGTDPTIFIPTRLTDGTNFYTASGGGGGTTVTVDHGTITLSNPTGTTVQFNNGTVNLLGAGTITRLEGGTIGLVTRVGNVGTLEVGTISVLPNIPGGTIGVVSTVSDIANLSKGTITRLEGGTVGLITRVNNVGTLEVGTISAMPNTPGGTLGLVTTVSNLTNGSVAVTAGTITSGTLVRVGNVGTLELGTVRQDPRPNRNILNFATTTTGTIGTLVAAPSAGSSIWITSLDVNVQSGTAEPLVSFGLVTNGLGVVSRGNYIAGGGIAKTYDPPTNAGNTGTALTFNILSGAGTVTYVGHYFIDVL